MNISDQYDSFWNGKDNVQSLGWGSDYSQTKRFDNILRIGIKNGDSLLDVGCGYGDLCPYILKCGILLSKYHGIDVRQKAINIAWSRERFLNNCTFYCGDIFSVEQKFDWVVASGIFCFKKWLWSKYVARTMDKMIELSVKGVSVNFLFNQKNSKKARGRKYVDLSEIHKFISKLGISKFNMYHDYMSNDITLHILK